MKLGIVQIVMAVIYLLIIVGIGLVMSRKVKSSDDFWVGGRSVGPIATAMSYCAAYVSTSAIIGSTSMFYLYGMGYAGLETMLSVLFCCFAIFVILGPKIRALSERLDVVSISGFLAIRYRSNRLRLLCGILVAVMMIPYAVAAMKGIGDTVNAVVGIPYITSVIILCIVACLYLTTSGYWGVATTDLIQGIMIAVSVVVVAISILLKTGGITPVMEYMAAESPERMTVSGGLPFLTIVSYTGVWPFIAFGQPQLMTKFMGLKDSRTVSAVIRVGIGWMVIFMFSLGLIDAGAFYLFQGKSFDNIDMIVPLTVANYSGTFVSGLFLCGILAAGISTLVALVLTSSSAVAKDIYEDFGGKVSGKKINAKKSVNISRVITGVVLLIVAIVSINPPDFVWSLSTMAAGTMGAAFTAPVILGLYWKRATTQGCYVSIIGGAAVTIIWYLAGLTTLIHSFVPGIAVSFILMVVVSLLTKPMPKDHMEVFFEPGCSKEKIQAVIESGDKN